MSHEWVSSRAVAWVIHEAPVPADLAWTLTVIAARCDEHGRGSYQSVPTIAEKTGKSARQVERDITRLRGLGLITLGDQSLTDHLRAGARPVVYDVALNLKGPKPLKESRNPRKGKAVDASTPVVDVTPVMDVGGDMGDGSTPVMDVASTPDMDDGEKKPLNNPLNNPSLGAAEQAFADATDATPGEREETIDLIIRENGVRRPDRYIPAMEPAELRAALTRVRARHATTPTPPPVPIVLAQARSSPLPAPRDEELTDREKAIAYARSRVGVSVGHSRASP